MEEPKNAASAATSDHPSGKRSNKWLSARLRWYLRIKNSFLFTQAGTFLVSAIALAVIAIQAWIYNEQRKTMDSTLAVLVKQTRIQEDSLRINRAYVSATVPVAYLKDKEIRLTLENVGHLPADKIKVEAREIRTFQGVMKGSVKRIEAWQLLASGEKTQVAIPLVGFDATELANIAARTEILHISVTIEYADGFGSLDTNNFCFEYRPPPDEAWVACAKLIRDTNQNDANSPPAP